MRSVSVLSNKLSSRSAGTLTMTDKVESEGPSLEMLWAIEFRNEANPGQFG